MKYEIKQIGILRTPYVNNAPYQPVNDEEGEFRIIVNPEYAEGLQELEKFRYIYVIYYLHRRGNTVPMLVSPPWASGKRVGVFASRSSVRPNSIGIRVVRVERIINNEIYVSGLDAYDGTPLLDIKPYINDLDVKTDADYGWIEWLEDKEHLLLHIKGIPHDS